MEDTNLHVYFAPVLIILQLIFLEGILSIDNAAVLGAMVSVLPDNKPVPYPTFLKFLQPVTDKYLGMQQMAALKVGLLGAYVGRAIMLLLATVIVQNPWLRLLGALYLIKLAFENLSVAKHSEKAEAKGRQLSVATFWLVVLNVELADLAFSVDNVVAAVALSNELWVVMLGVALGIVTMRFAAGIFTYLIRKEPIFEPAAYILVLAIGIELVLSDIYHLHFDHLAKFMISAGVLAACLAYARLKFLHAVAPALAWLGEGMGYINGLVNWGFRPFLVLLKLFFMPFGSLLAQNGRHLPEAGLKRADLLESAQSELVEG